MTRYTRIFADFLDSEDGATAIEYGLIVTLIALAIVGVLPVVRSGIISAFQTIAAALV